MIGLRLKNVTTEVLSRALCSLFGEAYALCTSYTFEDLIDSATGALEEARHVKFSYQETSQPFRASDGIVPIKTTLVLGAGADAVDFLARSPYRVLASSDLKTSALLDFFRAVNLGRDVDLRWYASRVNEMVDLAEWTLWNDFPNCFDGGEHLVLARDRSMLTKIHDALALAITDWLGNAGRVPTSEREQMELSFIDVKPEFLKVAPLYDR